MKKNDTIQDDECLYRSVRGPEGEEYTYDTKGKLEVRWQAFRDRNKKPSVDRAVLKGFDPAL